MGMAGVGLAIGAVGAIQGANSAKNAGKFNKRVGLMQARDAELRGVDEEARYRRELAQIIGAQRAEMGNRNVTASGSALDLLADTAMIGEEDVITIRNNAAREAWGYRMGAQEASRQAKAQSRNILMGGVGSTLTGGAQAYGQWKAG
jgi:hypothetical protein